MLSCERYSTALTDRHRAFAAATVRQVEAVPMRSAALVAGAIAFTNTKRVATGDCAMPRNLLFECRAGAQLILAQTRPGLRSAIQQHGEIMITIAFAAQFAREWTDAWNRHDVDGVLAHYSADFEMTSPYITRIVDEPTGTLKGAAAVRAYWNAALACMPGLKFHLVDALAGVDSITIQYRSARGLAAEVLFFNPEGKVIRAFAHYAQDL